MNDFVQKLKETYPPYKNLEGDALYQVIFATKPGSGACGKLSDGIAFFFYKKFIFFSLPPFQYLDSRRKSATVRT